MSNPVAVMVSGSKATVTGQSKHRAMNGGMKAGAIILAAALTAVATAGVADAHKQSAPNVREFVRVQGYRGQQPIKVPVVRTVELLVLGQQHPFQATTWRRFNLDNTADLSSEEVATQFTLQGDRATLQRFSTARPEQLVTILAERRPGSRDLFVLALDLCPPN
jgi:hypothetical protein